MLSFHATENRPGTIPAATAAPAPAPAPVLRPDGFGPADGSPAGWSPAEAAAHEARVRAWEGEGGAVGKE